MANHKLSYRTELDGLRAFAVLSVIIYHAELTWRGMSLIPGGFLGVDIFFVLSGFLITGILLERSPGLISFYKGRIDRIYPALLLMLLLSSLAAYQFLSPADMLAFAETLKGALGFYSNYVFMHEDAYISDASKYKALIHTWSLGVEWQYYLAFPLVIWLVKKFLSEDIHQVLIFLAATSFFYCLYLMGQNSTYAFYSTPARVWELFAGGLVFLLSKHLPKTKVDGFISAISLVILLYAILFFKDTDSNPGFISLVAVLGSGLFILFTRESGLVYKISTLKIAVFIGVISYSLYLYHQPVLVFYRIGFDEIGNKSFLLLLIIAILLAYLSYKFFENPMRRSKKNWKYLIVGLLVLFIFAFANGAKNTDGYKKRQSEDVRKALSYFEETEYRRLKTEDEGISLLDGKQIVSCSHRSLDTACRFGEQPANLVIVGDSYAGVFTPSFAEISNKYSTLILNYEQCPFLDQPIWFGGVPSCWQANKQRWQFFKQAKPTNILIGTNFNQFNKPKKSIENYQPGDTNLDELLTKKQAYESFRSSIEKLIKLGHNPIVLLMPPNPKADIKKEMERRANAGVLGFKNELTGAPSFKVDKEVKEALKGLDVRFIDLNSKMCNKAGKCLVFNEKGGLYNGGSHLSYFGAQLFIDDITQQMR